MTESVQAAPIASTVIYRIFVAGPSDVAADIEVAKQAISDASLVAQPFGVKFEPFDWHEVPPAVGAEPQAVISEHARGYHALLAIFGQRAGTPTQRHPSGTIEEVNDALERLTSLQFGGRSIMVFFREQQVSIRHIDLDSAVKLQSLRAMLSERGLFYKDYEDEVSLREAIFRSIGIFLAHHLKGERQGSLPATLPRSESLLLSDVEASDDDELGLLDYQEVIDSAFADSASALQAITETMSVLSTGVGTMTAEIQTATELSDRQRGRSAINALAKIMDNAAEEFFRLTPIVDERFKDALAASDRIIELQEADFGEGAARETRKRTLEAFDLMRPRVLATRDAMLRNLEAQRGLARMTKESNAAKRKMLLASERMVSAYNNILSQVDEQLIRLSLPSDPQERYHSNLD